MEKIPPASRFEHANFILGILNFVVMIFFSIVTWGLAQKSYELTVNDKSQTLQLQKQDLQLEKLTRLYENSQMQLLKQDDMLKEVGYQLTVANRHYKLDAETAKNFQIANFHVLRKVLHSMKKFVPSSGVAKMKSMAPEKRLGFIDSIKTMVEGELQNPYVIERKDVFESWSYMATTCYFTKNFFEDSDNLWTADKEFLNKPLPAGQKITTHPVNEEERQQILNKYFSDFIDQFYRFYFFNIKNVIVDKNGHLRDR